MEMIYCLHIEETWSKKRQKRRGDEPASEMECMTSSERRFHPWSHHQSRPTVVTSNETHTHKGQDRSITPSRGTTPRNPGRVRLRTKGLEKAVKQKGKPTLPLDKRTRENRGGTCFLYHSGATGEKIPEKNGRAWRQARSHGLKDIGGGKL